MPSSVLITGSSGFIGSAALQACRQAGCDAVGLGRRVCDQLGYVRHDLTQPLDGVIKGSFDAVIHAAARSSPWGSQQEFERNNVEATRLLLDYCVRHGTPAFIFLSSSSVLYRSCHQLQMDEATPLAPKAVNAYAASKQRAEALVRQYPGRWCILRPRAVFGPGDTVLFPRILAAARAGRLPLLSTSPPSPGSDLIYIDNLVDCLVCAVERDDIEGLFHLSNGEPVDIQSLLVDVLGQLGIAAPKRRVGLRKAMTAAAVIELFYRYFLPRSEPPITRFGVHVFAYSKTFNVGKMVQHFGPPRVSIAEGVRHFVAWTKSQDGCA